MKGCIIERKGKNGKSSWLIKYDLERDPVTNQRRVRYVTVRGTKKDAEKELRARLKQVDDGVHVDPSKLTFRQWAEAWKGVIKPIISIKTFERYNELLTLHALPNLGDIPLQKLSAIQVQSLLSKLRPSAAEAASDRKGLSERSLLHLYRVLNQCLSEAVTKNLLIRNPCDAVTPPKPKDKKARTLDSSTVKTFLKGFRDHNLFVCVALALGTGMRRGEILALRWADIDFDRKTIRIEHSTEETGIGGLRIKSPKNESSKRTIEINDSLANSLGRHWREQAQASFKFGIRIGAESFVFPRSPVQPTTPSLPSYVTKRFKKKAQALGYKDLRFHDLRHTYATLLLTDGNPVHAVAQRLGHSTPNITLKVYGHVLKRSEEQAVRISASILDDALEG